MDLLTFKYGRLSDRGLRSTDFLKPFYMLKYISIFIPGLYYMTCFGYGTVLFATTGASLFAKFYHFDVAQTGLMLSIPLLIGCLIGEFNAGVSRNIPFKIDFLCFLLTYIASVGHGLDGLSPRQKE